MSGNIVWSHNGHIAVDNTGYVLLEGGRPIPKAELCELAKQSPVVHELIAKDLGVTVKELKQFAREDAS